MASLPTHLNSACSPYIFRRGCRLFLRHILAALRGQDKIAPDAAVVTVFCDDNKKYLSTALMRDEPLREDYLTPHIELLGLGTVGRQGVLLSFPYESHSDDTLDLW
ncbi:MAG: hypothetical protein ACHQT6_08615 [Candidatus Acidiferrales bacterium]